MIGNPPFDRRFWGDFLLEFDQAGHVECQLSVAGMPKPSVELPPALSAPPTPAQDRRSLGDGESDTERGLNGPRKHENRTH